MMSPVSSAKMASAVDIRQTAAMPWRFATWLGEVLQHIHTARVETREARAAQALRA